MKNEFLKRLTENEYISNYLYEYIKEQHQEIIPINFDIEKYNEQVLNNQYQKYEQYFKNMYKGIDDSISLDENQIKTILADEDYTLILAGAGTGKTTTIASKVKYLTEIKKVEPSKIVVMSYTKKATEELEKRIVTDLGIPAEVTTFHSLGLKYIREIFNNRKCYVVDQNIRNQIFYQYFKEEIFPYKNKIKEILDNFIILKDTKKFIFGKHFIQNYEKFNTFEEYFEDYKKYKLSEVNNIKTTVEETIDKEINSDSPITINNELVKSKGEAIIANFLYCNGIEYHYEKIYDKLMPENKTYKPDFTIEYGGEEIYIEYFGLSTYKENEIPRYEKIKKLKEEYHRTHKTKFVKIDYMPGENIIKTLTEELAKLGIRLMPKSYKEIYLHMLNRNPIAQIFQYKTLLYSVIENIKTSNKRTKYLEVVKEYIDTLSDEEKRIARIQFKYINDFYLYYQKQLFQAEEYGFDFSDMIYYANLYIDKIQIKNNLHFEYLIIDEYQDISSERYYFAKSITKKNNAKIIAVGDDWQSIFGFAGSRVKYIYDFKKYFKASKILRINKTYRNSQDLIDYSGNFIMKNPKQIKKDLVSEKMISHPIKFVLFEEDKEYKTLKELILRIHNANKNHNIMILARKNSMIEKCYNDPELKDEIDTKITYVGYEDIKIDGMTIHKSKGLTSDEVIIIGLNNHFPEQNHSLFWLKHIFSSPLEEEPISFAEERRLFYVALTRTKNNVYLLVNKNPKLRSRFINEIYNIMQEVDEEKQEIL